MKLETGNWKLGVMVLAVLAGLSLQAGPLGIERLEEIEALDTVLDDGEVVAIKTPTDPATVQLRYGDGETAGGIIVADPYSIKAAYHRALSRSEYSVTMAGNCTVSNGVYKLLTERQNASSYSAANVGSITVLPRGDVLLSGCSYTQSLTLASVTSDESPGYALGATGIVFTASEYPTIGNPINGNVSARVGGLTVFGWMGTHLIGKTNDCRGTMLLVADAVGDDEALNLGEHNRLMLNHRGENWSLYAATQQVNLAWQDLILNPYAKWTGTAKGADLTLTTPKGEAITNAISVRYDRAASTIVGYVLSATNVTLIVEAGVTLTAAPAIHGTTSNLLTAVWTARATTTDWPTQTSYTASNGKRFPTWTLRAARTAGAAQEFFKVVGYPAAGTNSVTVNLPLVPAGGITMGGTNITSWAELKALLDGMP